MPNFISGLPATGSPLVSAEIRNNFLALNERTDKLTPLATVPASTKINIGAGTIYFADHVPVQFTGQQLDLGSDTVGVSGFTNIGYFRDIVIVLRQQFDAESSRYSATAVFLEGPEKASSTLQIDLVQIASTDIPIAAFVVRHNGLNVGAFKGQIEPIPQANILDVRNFVDAGGSTFASAIVGDRVVQVNNDGTTIVNQQVSTITTEPAAPVSIHTSNSLMIARNDATKLEVGYFIQIIWKAASTEFHNCIVTAITDVADGTNSKSTVTIYPAYTSSFPDTVNANTTISILDVGGSTVGTHIGFASGTSLHPLQRAINYVASLGGGTVFVRRGLYLPSATITVPSNVHLIGEGRSTVIIRSDTYAGPLIKLTGESASVSQLFLQGPPSHLQASGPLLEFENAKYCIIKDCTIDADGVTGVGFMDGSLRNTLTTTFITKAEVAVIIGPGCSKNLIMNNQVDDYVDAFQDLSGGLNNPATVLEFQQKNMV